jgi:aspartate kinase
LTLDDAASIEPIVGELKRLGDVEIEANQAVVCVVGEGLRSAPGLASKIFSTVSDVNISMISHGASSVNLTFVVREENVTEVIKKLHNTFFNRVD